LELIHNTDASKYPKLIIKYIGREEATEVPDLSKVGYNPIHIREKIEIDVAKSKFDNQKTQICVIDKTCYFDNQWYYYSKDHSRDSNIDENTPIFEYIGYTSANISESKTNCEIIEEQISILEEQLKSSRANGCRAASGGKSRKTKCGKTKRSKSKRGKSKRNKRRSSRRRR